MACCCEDIRTNTAINRYPSAFEILDALPTAETELDLIDTEYGADGSGMQVTADEQARCNAYTAWIRALSLYAASHNEAGAYGYAGVAIALAAGSALVLFGVLTGGLGLALGLGIGALGGTFGSLTAAQYISNLRNPVNDKELVCQLLEAMPFNNPSFLELEAAVNALETNNNGEESIKYGLQTWGLRNKYGHYLLLDYLQAAVDGELSDQNCDNCGDPEHFIIIGEADNLLDVQFNSSSGFRQLWIYTNRTNVSVGEDRVFIRKGVNCFPMFEFTSSAFPPSNYWNIPCGGTESPPEDAPPTGTSMHQVGFASWINGSTILQIYVTDEATFEIQYL